MENEQKNKKRSYRGWIIAAVVILVLVIGGRLVLKSDWLFNKLREVAVEQAEQQLRGSLSIDNIEGDLLNGFSIRDIRLQGASGKQIAYIDSVKIGYDFFPALLSPHTIETVEVYGLNLLVEQYSDSTWNVIELIPPGDQPSEESAPLLWMVENLALSGVQIEVKSDQYLPNDDLFVDRLFADLSVGMLESGFSSTLRELEFAVKDSRLPEAVEVYLAGAAKQDQYTLESIVINTGRSMLRGSASYEKGGEVEQSLQLSPLSWRDLSEYAADVPLEQNIEIELNAGGTLANLRFTLNASGDGLQDFKIEAVSSMREPLRLKSLSITAGEVNAPLLTGIENSPVTQSLNFEGSGAILIDQPSNSSWDGSLTVENASYQSYRFDRFQTSYYFENGSLDLDGNVLYENEEVVFTADADSLLGIRPNWNFHAESERINPALWLQNEKMAGNLNFNIDAMGSGFDLSDFSSSADIVINGEEFRGQPFSQMSFSGSINQNRVTGNVLGLLQESQADVDFTIYDWQSNPEYEFLLKLQRLNLAEFRGLEEFPTYINGQVEGEGSSFNPEEMRIMATANFDSSIVNGEEVREMNTDIQVKNEYIIIEDGSLISPIADASFMLNHHIFELTDRSNRLNFEAELKELSPLAPLFNVEELRTEGTLSGNLGRNAEEMLEFNGFLDLEDVTVDTIFTASEISGRIAAYITEQPEFDINIELSEPHIYQTTVQDMQVYIYAKRMESETIGNVSLQLQNGNESVLRQSGEFSIDSTRSYLLTETLDFETDLRELTLEKPFAITYSNESFSVDTLTISSEKREAHLRLWAPQIDSLNQTGGLNAQNLNIGVLQQTILRESYFDGFLNGSVQYHNSPDSLDISARARLTELQLSDGKMDTLDLNMQVQNEWLTANLQGWNNGSKLAEGSFKVPYLPGDPLTFDDKFFEGQVNGEFSFYESSLKYWLSFLPEGVPEGTGGTISSNFKLEGIAGNPEIDGNISVKDGLFSGIRVDTIGVDIAYLHEEERLDFNGSIIRDRQEILNFDADLPFLVDLKRAEIHTPTNDDEVMVDVNTNNFDLALFNNYVNRNRIRSIKGQLEGAVTLSGEMDNLQAEGKMQLNRGSIRIVQAGTTLSDIKSEVEFNKGIIELRRFTAKSGPGQLKANGQIAMQGLEPDEMNIDISANRFQLLNTSDYNAIIQLSASMSGTLTEPRLQGNLTFLNGFYYLQDFGDRQVENVELESENQDVEPFDFYEALDMEFTIAFNNQFYIRNQQYLDAEIEVGGRVDLLKEPEQDMQLFGTLEGTEGYARPLGKEFTLEEGLVTFYGPPENPELNIRTSFTPPQSAGVEIFYIIEGTLEEPEFRFDSQPPLELQDIISYTLFGRPFYELESWEQVVAGSGSSPSAADYALQVLLDRVEMIASRRLGIDVVRIDNSTSGSNNTVIQTGWYLNQETFFSILTEIDGASPKTLFMLEILLQDNLELIITQGDDTRQGIDLQWKRDY